MAQSGAEYAHAAYPILIETLTLWDGKQAGHALTGLAHVIRADPRLAPDALGYAQKYVDDPRGVVRRAAKALQKAGKSSA
jgi:hypothetical protein